MAIAHDAISSSAAEFREASQGNPFAWNHTPTGTPKGVVVFIYSEADLTGVADNVVDTAITGVTYGGVAMTRIRPTSARSTSTEQLLVWGYELTSSVPTGVQSISVTMNANPVTGTAVFPWFWGWAATMTAGTSAIKKVDDDFIGSSSTVTNPSLTMNNGSDTCMTYFGGMSGAGTLANITPGTGVTELGERQMVSTTRSAYFERSTSAASGDNTYGMTIAVDDAAMIMASYAEFTPSVSPVAFMGGGFF